MPDLTACLGAPHEPNTGSLCQSLLFLLVIAVPPRFRCVVGVCALVAVGHLIYTVSGICQTALEWLHWFWEEYRNQIRPEQNLLFGEESFANFKRIKFRQCVMFYWAVVKYFRERFPVHKALPKHWLTFCFVDHYNFSFCKPGSNCPADFLHREQENKVCTEPWTLWEVQEISENAKSDSDQHF